MEVKMIGIDLAKTVFQICGMNKEGRVLFNRTVHRSKFFQTITQLNPQIVAMEACGSANYWGRRFRDSGVEVRLIAAQFVKPYVKTNKSDYADAEAIAEAGLRPTMRFVPIKSVEQQDVKSLHRIRDRLVRQRTALVNETRGLLAEYGIVIREGVTEFSKMVPVVLEQTDNDLTDRTRELINCLFNEFNTATDTLKGYDKKIAAVFKQSEICRRIEKTPGVGPLIATLIYANYGDAKVFKNGRQFASSLGLTPRHTGSGGSIRIGRISRRGDPTLRAMMVHGARAVVSIALGKDSRDPTTQWINKLYERRGYHRTVVALANKNARCIWALMATGEEYRTA